MQSDSALTDIKQDRLGRNEFAIQIANGLVNSFKDNHESIVIGINGEWGSGKSTLVNFVVQEIEEITKNEDYKPVIIRFNPWMFSGQKELQTIFLREMYLAMKRDLGFFKKNAKRINPLLNSLELFINAMVLANNPALVGASSRVTGFFNNFIKNINEVTDVHSLKIDIDKSMIETGSKIYITIDDIDRLNPTEITEILQMVKLNANFANTVFILCYDYDVVVSALKNKFGENGEKYLEKIVQVDYTLPHISKDKIRELFVEEMGKLFDIEELNTELKDFVENDNLILPFFSTLRDMYRFLNAIKLRLEFIYEEVNIGDFLLIETLRIFDKKAYQFVIDNKEILTKIPVTSNDYDKEEYIKNSSLNKSSQQIIEYCFKVSSLLKFYFDSHFSFEGARPKSVLLPQYFDRYFSLALTSKDLSEVKFNQFINENTIKGKISVLHSIEKNQFQNFFILLSHKVETEEIAKVVIKSIFLFWSTETNKISGNMNSGILAYVFILKLYRNKINDKNGKFIIDLVASIKNTVLQIDICNDFLSKLKKEYNDYIVFTEKNESEIFKNELIKSANESLYFLVDFLKNNLKCLSFQEINNILSRMNNCEVVCNNETLDNMKSFINSLNDSDFLLLLLHLMKLESYISKNRTLPFWLEADYVLNKLISFDKNNLSLKENRVIELFYLFY